MVGRAEGILVGTEVGESEGEVVGSTDGDLLGTADGVIVGRRDGFVDGRADGTVDGSTDGDLLGRKVLGAAVGATVGTSSNVIRRIMLLAESATKAYVPSGETLTPVGWLNLALVPTAFVDPLDLATPATVVTERVEMMTWRINSL
jgi:hypothetical protein